MVKIRKFGVMQTAKVLAMLYFIITAAIYVPVGLVAILLGLMQGAGDRTELGVAIMLVTPVAAGVGSFVAVALSCVIYNRLSRYTGGIAIEFEA